MAFMIEDFRNSREWRHCRRNRPRAFPLMNLLMAAFHSVPAGSLEDDDQALADAAGVSDEEWAKMRDDMLGEWLLCSDGRWYHPYLGPIVTKAWESALAQKARTKAATEAKLARAASSRQRNDNVTLSNREGEGDGDSFSRAIHESES